MTTPAPRRPSSSFALLLPLSTTEPASAGEYAASVGITTCDFPPYTTTLRPSWATRPRQPGQHHKKRFRTRPFPRPPPSPFHRDTCLLDIFRLHWMCCLLSRYTQRRRWYFLFWWRKRSPKGFTSEFSTLRQ